MRIENDIKLGFKEVIIFTKRATLKSRSEITLEINFTFLHATISWEGIPIMAANMVANCSTSDGNTVKVPYIGKISETVTDFLGGLRSTFTYVVLKSLKELKKRMTFIRVQERVNVVFNS